MFLELKSRLQTSLIYKKYFLVFLCVGYQSKIFVALIYQVSNQIVETL